MEVSHPQLGILMVTSQLFEENAYLLYENRSAQGLRRGFVVDPGMDAQRIIAATDRCGFTPEAIVCTHGHADHIAGNEALKARWPDCPLIIGAGDADKLTDPAGNLSAGFGVQLISPPADRTIRGGDKLELAGVRWSVVDAPGHSSGHIALIARELSPMVVIGGDVLFAGSIGRSDLYDSDPEALIATIHEQFYTLPDDAVVLPGHGPTTTIGVEKRSNPFVRSQ